MFHEQKASPESTRREIIEASIGVSLVKTEEGSRFARELIVEEAAGHRSTVSASQEIYDRAQSGMLSKERRPKALNCCLAQDSRTQADKSN